MKPRTRGLIKSVHSAEQKVFLDLLVKARKNAGLTQQEVASRLKKSQSFVARYEGGERRIDVVEFLEVSRALEIDPIRLLRSLKRRI